MWPDPWTDDLVTSCLRYRGMKKYFCPCGCKYEWVLWNLRTLWCTREAWWSTTSLPRLTGCFAKCTRGSWHQKSWAFSFQDPERGPVTGTGLPTGGGVCVGGVRGVSCAFPVKTRACCYQCTSLVPVCVKTEREFYSKPNIQTERVDAVKRTSDQ